MLNASSSHFDPFRKSHGSPGFAERTLRNMLSGSPRHSGLMPANLTTLAHFSVSSAISLPKSGDVPPTIV